MRSSPRASIGFEHVRGVHRALGAAGPEDRVQLVDEQHDPASRCARVTGMGFAGRAAGVGDLGEHGLEPLLELAAILGAGHHAGQVERDDAAAGERGRHVALSHAQRQALGDRGLADAGLADQDGVVLAPAGEDLDGLLDLLGAADDGVDPPGPRVGGQVAPELVERRGLRSGRAGGGRALLARPCAVHQVARAGLADDGALGALAVGRHDAQRPGAPAADGAGAARRGERGVGEGVQGECAPRPEISVCAAEISALTGRKRGRASQTASATASASTGASLNRLWPASAVTPGRRASVQASSSVSGRIVSSRTSSPTGAPSPGKAARA
jgi:hypothetical protein